MTGREALAADVPRETMERLEVYASLLTKWNPKINIVAPSTLPDLWSRHFADSLQLATMAPAHGHWLDLGSGGGFPGLITAIAHADTPGFRATLIESDQRKAAFLRTVVRETGLTAKIITDRIETAPPQASDVLTARALAPLDTLLAYTERHRTPSGTALFPKGESWRDEVAQAEANWRFHYEMQPSTTNPGSVILKIGECARA